LVAAAGPDAVYIATTESVRKAFEGEKSGDSEVRPFTPQAKVPLPIRISQLAFTADEQYLILSAEQGGGLAVYDVQTLVQGGTQSAFELSTNGETLRALVPNPMPESAGFCAIVTNNGNLFMANLAERKLVSGSNGPTLRSQVSCAAWSTKGKQLVAGMADGSIHQMTPDGAEKGHIPKPPSLGDYHGKIHLSFREPCSCVLTLTSFFGRMAREPRIPCGTQPYEQPGPVRFPLDHSTTVGWWLVQFHFSETHRSSRAFCIRQGPSPHRPAAQRLPSQPSGSPSSLLDCYGERWPVVSV
jgi:hypothetical protein